MAGDSLKRASSSELRGEWRRNSLPCRLDIQPPAAILTAVSFVAELNALALDGLLARARTSETSAVIGSLGRARLSLADFAVLISPAGAEHLDTMAWRARAITRQRFGRVIRLFAPLYLSNECVNNCPYCGFARDNSIRRVTLTVEEVVREARALRASGFRSLLVVAGEHTKLCGVGYLEECVRALHAEAPSISLEIGPLATLDYRRLVDAGAEGLVIYQETYNRAGYEELHHSGPKRNFDWRLETPERAYAAGFRRLGIGALLGLHDWRGEALCVAAHAVFLLRHCWKASLTVSVPRLRPCTGAFSPRASVTDRELAQLVCALRLFLPDVGIVLSTREPVRLRDGLIPLGITLISAGSHTEPGGYTGAGREHTHLTTSTKTAGAGTAIMRAAAPLEVQTGATGQFEVADERSPSEVADRIRQLGYEPVWKDWDGALCGCATPTSAATSSHS